MATIIEDYVSFEVAKLLQEKGFDVDIDNWYDKDGESFFCYHYDISNNWRVKIGQKVYLCPTLQMACKWLREVHKLHIMTNCVGRVNYDPIVQGFDGKDYEIEGVEVSTTKLINDKWMVVRRGFKTNELAVEAAIKYCLQNLI